MDSSQNSNVPGNARSPPPSSSSPNSPSCSTEQPPWGGGRDAFGRVWCVAEIVRAAWTGVPQQLVLRSDELVAANYMRLTELDVEDCEATREEDREAILKQISNVAAFNTFVQHLLFGDHGVFGRWMSSADALLEICRIARRAGVGSGRRSRQSLGHLA